MPHIIVMHSLDLDLNPLLHDLHENLADQETVSKIQIKTYEIPLKNHIVGDLSKAKDMIHIQLRMKPGRAPELKEKISQDLHDAARAFVNAKGIISAVSVEIHELDAPTYRSSYD